MCRIHLACSCSRQVAFASIEILGDNPEIFNQQSADRHCHPTILLAMIVHRADLPDLPTDCNQLVEWGLVDEVSGVMLAIPGQIWPKRIRSDRCALKKT